MSAERLRRRDVVRWFTDVYAEAALEPTLLRRAQGLHLVLPAGAAFTRATAAELYGLPVGPDPDLHVSVSGPADRPRPRDGVRPHESLPASDVQWLGLPVSTPARTFTDLAETLRLDDLVALGDAIVRRLATCLELDQAVARAAGRRGVVRAREASSLVRDWVDSPMETRLRLLLVRAGLPCPEVNRPVHDATGGYLGSPDLAYAEARIAIEYEGDQHRTDRQQWRDDLWRYERFAAAGWLVIRVTADDVIRRPQLLVERIRRALAERLPRP